MIIAIIAGVSVEIHDAIRAIPLKRFVPHGKLVVKPLTGHAYSDAYAQSLIQSTYDYIIRATESEPISLVLCYVDHDDGISKNFVRIFFPYALPVKIHPLDLTGVKDNKGLNRATNIYVKTIEREVRRGISLASRVSHVTHVHNLTPLLLPVRNFQSPAICSLLEKLFWDLHKVGDPDILIKEAVKAFFAADPRVTPQGEHRHCFSDGKLYFKSPGKNRHGYFRNSGAASHKNYCLLNARSRIGGAFDYRFHYDCTPVKGNLSPSYPNCHNIATACKSTHVNIAPNDYIT